MQLPEPFIERRRSDPGEPPPPHGRRSRDALRQVQQRLESLEERLAQCQRDDEQEEERPHGFQWYG